MSMCLDKYTASRRENCAQRKQYMLPWLLFFLGFPLPHFTFNFHHYFTENNSPALDRKSESTKPESQLISEAQSAFDEEDEFSK